MVLVAGRKRKAHSTDKHRRESDRPIYRAAQRAERVIIAAIAALAARSAGQDISRAIILLVLLMAIAEFTDWLFFQRGYRSLFRDLADCEDQRVGLRRADDHRGRKRSTAGARAQHRDYQKTADQAHLRKR